MLVQAHGEIIALFDGYTKEMKLVEGMAPELETLMLAALIGLMENDRLDAKKRISPKK